MYRFHCFKCSGEVPPVFMVSYTREQVEALRGAPPVRGGLGEYLAAGGYLSMVWERADLLGGEDTSQRSIYALYLCATSEGVEAGREYNLVDVFSMGGVRPVDALFISVPERFFGWDMQFDPFLAAEEVMLNRHGLTRYDITVTLPPHGNRVANPVDVNGAPIGSYPYTGRHKYFLYDRDTAINLRELYTHRTHVPLKVFLKEYLRLGGKVTLTGKGEQLASGDMHCTLSLGFTNFNTVEGISPLFKTDHTGYLDVFDTLEFTPPTTRQMQTPSSGTSMSRTDLPPRIFSTQSKLPCIIVLVRTLRPAPP